MTNHPFWGTPMYGNPQMYTIYVQQDIHKYTTEKICNQNCMPWSKKSSEIAMHRVKHITIGPRGVGCFSLYPGCPWTLRMLRMLRMGQDLSLLDLDGKPRGNHLILWSSKYPCQRERIGKACLEIWMKYDEM